MTIIIFYQFWFRIQIFLGWGFFCEPLHPRQLNDDNASYCLKSERRESAENYMMTMTMRSQTLLFSSILVFVLIMAMAPSPSSAGQVDFRRNRSGDADLIFLLIEYIIRLTAYFISGVEPQSFGDHVRTLFIGVRPDLRQDYAADHFRRATLPFVIYLTTEVEHWFLPEVFSNCNPPAHIITLWW